MLYTLVEPHRGHEVAYNRWYERDHFYAGCQIGAYNFAGAPLRGHRSPERTPLPPGRRRPGGRPRRRQLPRHLLRARRPPRRVEPVGGRPGQRPARRRTHVRERDHVHTGLYRFEWEHGATPTACRPSSRWTTGSPVGLGPVEPAAGVTGANVGAWVRGQYLPSVLAVRRSRSCSGSARCPCWPTPRVRAPGDTLDERVLMLAFVDDVPTPLPGRRVRPARPAVADAGVGSVCGRPPSGTVPGTDTYTDQLWADRLPDRRRPPAPPAPTRPVTPRSGTT